MDPTREEFLVLVADLVGLLTFRIKGDLVLSSMYPFIGSPSNHVK